MLIPRVDDCIALLQVDNKEGSGLFLNLHSGKIVRRNHFECRPTSSQTIAFMNSLAAKEGRTRKTQLDLFISLPAEEFYREELTADHPPGYFVPPPPSDGQYNHLTGLEDHTLDVRPTSTMPPPVGNLAFTRNDNKVVHPIISSNSHILPPPSPQPTPATPLTVQPHPFSHSRIMATPARSAGRDLSAIRPVGEGGDSVRRNIMDTFREDLMLRYYSLHLSHLI